jgi:hypothetical protein
MSCHSVEDMCIRCGDDNLSIYELLVEFRVLALLVRGGNESVSLVLEPFADTKLVLSCACLIVNRALHSNDIVSISYLAIEGHLWRVDHLF